MMGPKFTLGGAAHPARTLAKNFHIPVAVSDNAACLRTKDTEGHPEDTPR